MSGGSLEYASLKVDDIIDMVKRHADNVLYKAFADHLKKVSAALYELEWVLSGDKSAGAETEVIMDVIGPQGLLEAAIKQANQAHMDLCKAIVRAESVND